MGNTIEDGTGQGYRAAVNANHELSVRAVSLEQDTTASEKGDAYNLNTGFVSLTGTSDSAVLYVKNNEERDLIINFAAISLSTMSATVSNVPRVTIVRNPTGGTIISNAVALPYQTNRNYGSSKTLDVDAYVGVDGDTMTGGDVAVVLQNPAPSRFTLPANLIIPTGKAIGIKINVNTTGGGDVHAALICYLRDPNEVI